MKYKKYLLIIIAAILVFVPRVALLLNGLDHQRIWDTNTGDAFQAVQSVREGKFKEFLIQNHKYPLLGSFLYVPVIGAYYGAQITWGQYEHPDDVVKGFVLQEDSIYFWIRLEVLLFQLVALGFLAWYVSRFTKNFKTGLYVLLFGAVSFYLTLFSVTPRIHNLAFSIGTAVLLSSLLLMKKKTWGTYMLSFGLAGLSAAISQSGFVNFLLPLFAHFYISENEKWGFKIKKKYVDAKLWVGIISGKFLALLFGYPGFFAVLVKNPKGLPAVFLSPEHTQPGISLVSGIKSLFHFFWSVETLFLAIFLCAVWYGWLVRERMRIYFDSYDFLLALHIVVFFLVFGFVNVTTGRFFLAIFPSLLFLSARTFAKIDNKWGARTVIGLVVLLQLYGTLQLTRIAMQPDTREEAAKLILEQGSKNDVILSAIDHHLLGINPSVSSLEKMDPALLGSGDKIVKEKKWEDTKTRDYTFWNIRPDMESIPELKPYDYVLTSMDKADAAISAHPYILEKNFELKQTISNRLSGKKREEFLSWDIPSPRTFRLLPFVLDEYRSFGPTILIYSPK